MKRSKLLNGVACASFVLALGGCSKVLSEVGVGADGGAGASAGGLSLSGLEGEIDLTATGKPEAGKPAKPLNLALLVKGNKFRTDLPTGIEGAEKLGKVYAIYDADAKKAFVVLDQQKEVVEIDMNTIGDQVKAMKPPTSHAGSAGTAEPPKYPPKLTKTGKMDTVAGYSCETWEVSSTEPNDKSKADVCVSSGGVSFFHFPMTGAPAEYAALGELVDGSHFPLRGIGYDKDGTTETGRLEVTKVDKHTLDPNLFVPPPTYKVVNVQEAMQGFMAAAMGGAGNPGATGFGANGGGMPNLPPAGFGGHPHGLPQHH